MKDGTDRQKSRMKMLDSAYRDLPETGRLNELGTRIAAREIEGIEKLFPKTTHTGLDILGIIIEPA